MDANLIAKEIDSNLIMLLTAGVGIFIMVLNSIKDVIKFKVNNWKTMESEKMKLDIKNLEMKSLDFMEHPFWATVYAYFNTRIENREAPNAFKKIVATEYLRVSWAVYEKWFKSELIPFIKDDVTQAEVFEFIIRGAEQGSSLRKEELRKLGMDEKIIDTLEKNRLAKIDNKLSMYQRILYSKAYTTIHSRVYAILDLQFYILEDMSNDIWTAVVNSNGELYNLSFQGHVNIQP